ncbi:MAG: class A beta-lactamase-related serine hydrolase [Cyclobacteriaceae bacterium]|nr:class A beta-lactamase-related serine hydrolase [Cyclobacteriaceae bacterium]
MFLRRNLLLHALLLSQVFTSCRPPAEPSLQDLLTERIKIFRGDVGLYVHHLGTGETVAIRADSLFPTASLIKVPIMLGVFNKIEKGELDYHAQLTYHDSLLYPGEDILGSFRDGEKISLSKVLMLMITTSDNTASLWCQQLAGTGSAINTWLEENGFRHTRVNSRTPGREADREKFGWGQTTPREMADMLIRIRRGELVSPRASERIYRNLARIYWDSEALAEIPPYVQVASKQGAVNQSRSEVVLVNAPHGDYVFCLITKNQEDQSWQPANGGFVLLRDVSRILWNYFEPGYGWHPAEGATGWY